MGQWKLFPHYPQQRWERLRIEKEALFPEETGEPTENEAPLPEETDEPSTQHLNKDSIESQVRVFF